MTGWTEADAIDHMRAFTPEAQVLAVLSGICGEQEQSGMQRHPPTPIQSRVMLHNGLDRLLKKAIEVGLVAEVEPDSEAGLIPIPEGYAEQ